MKILTLLAKNVKRLSVVEINPQGNVVELAGDNAAGKTSVLDSIGWALEGDRAVQWKPIRDGEESAVIELGIGDDKIEYRVTKKFRAGKGPGDKVTMSLRVEDAGGAPVRHPQTILNGFLGSLALDPAAFIEADPNGRIAVLKGLCDFDFDANSEARRRVYEERTAVNREARRLRAQAAGIEVPPGTPAKELPIEDLTLRLEEASTAAAAIERAKAYRADLERQRDALLKSAKEYIEAAHSATNMANGNKESAEQIGGMLNKLPPPPEPVDTVGLRDQIKAADVTNRAVEKRQRREKLQEDADANEKAAAHLAEILANLDREAVEAVAAADLPVRGMTIGENDVMLNGQPFGQASGAEQLRASVALAIGEAPTLKVIRIRDGNRFDDKAFAVLVKVAEEMDYQIWIESIKPHSATAIIMEDGHVAE